MAIFICFFLLSSVSLSAQDMIRTSGTVTDGAGEALAGVSVVERGTSNGTVTNADGEYSLSVQPNATLAFSFIGFTTVERAAVAGVLDVVMQEDATVHVLGENLQKMSNNNQFSKKT